MMQNIPFLTRNWVGDIVVAPQDAWTWALALLIPTAISGSIILITALRELGGFAKLLGFLRVVGAHRSRDVVPEKSRTLSIVSPRAMAGPAAKSRRTALH